MLNSTELKKDFPIFKRKISDKDIVYLDNSATTHKPKQVIDAVVDFYSNHNSNVHRGIYTLSEEATDLYENVRAATAKFINARQKEEIVFNSGATEGLNTIAYGYFLPRLESNHSIISTKLEHHSNMIPWQQIAKTKDCVMKMLDFDSDGNISLDQLDDMLDESVKVVALTHVSNVIGSILPIKRICEMAHKVGALVVVDGSQSISHMPIDVQSLDCDFYVFSAHKMLGPTGTGVMYGKREYLDIMNPITFGGGMINKVNLDDATWAPSPEKFEAGTPNVAGVVGLGAAINYLEHIGMENIRSHEQELNAYAVMKLLSVSGLHIIGTENPVDRAGLISFYIEDIHSHDIAAVLSEYNVCVRSGHHCTMPLHNQLNINSSTRASFYLYNTKEDIDALTAALWKAIEILK